MITKTKQILNKELFMLKVSEWVTFGSIILLYTGLTIWIILANPFESAGSEVPNYWSMAMSWIAATFTILGTFFLAKGKKFGFLLDAIAFFALALNLIWIANDPMLPLGIFYMLVPVPVTFLAYFLWKKRQNNDKGEVEASKNFKLYTTLFVVGGTALIFGTIYGVVGYNNLVNSDHGLGNVWEIPRMFLEILKIMLMVVATLFFVMGIKEAWTVVMLLEATNIALYSISFACSPTPDAGYFLNIWLYVFEFSIATWGAFNWYFRKIKNN